MRKSYGEQVAKLEANQVFVFGSNLNGGFHGAGAAGFASFGVSGNRWREFDYASKPFGWKGKWNVKGIGEGLQEGTEGKSYALPTVLRAGDKCSRTRDEIVASIRKMYDVALKNPELTFLVAGSSAGGKEPLNGYSHKDMCRMYFDAGQIPGNVVFSKSYTEMVFAQKESEGIFENDQAS